MKNKMKYVISFDTEFGCVSAESENPEDLFSAYSSVQQIAESLSSKMKDSRKAVNHKSEKRFSPKVPETSIILRELESSVLDSKFFEEAKTTGETREKLHDLTGKYFASRKVSQALGILKDRGRLKRKGKRNYYQYSLA
jgi:hypothetical protein